MVAQRADLERPPYTAIRAERVRRSLALFVRELWHVLEPNTPLVWSRHLDAICAKLEAVSRGEIRRLVICVPPGSMKSLLVSVFWPAWEWLTKPGLSGLYTSNDDDLVKRDSRRMRDLVTSDEYRALVALLTPPGRVPWTLAADQNQKHWFATTARGFRQCFPIRGKVTGKRAARLVIDDPYDVKELMGSVERVAERMAEIVRIYNTTLESRLNDKRVDAVVLIMQRVHEADLAGVKIAEGWDSLVLPMEFVPEAADPLDWRTEPGELLEPVRFPRSVVEETRATLTAAAYSALYQQAPTPAEGDLFRREAWALLPRVAYPPKFDRVFLSADLAFKGTARSDFCAFFVVGQVGARFYVLDRVRERLHYGDQKAALLRLLELYPAIGPKLVEDKANAHALLDDLHRDVPGLVLVPASTGKEERAQAWAHVQAARQIVLPGDAPWTDSVITEHEAFPRGVNDDQVDALGHGILWALAHPVKPTRLNLDPGSLAGASYWRS